MLVQLFQKEIFELFWSINKNERTLIGMLLMKYFPWNKNNATVKQIIIQQKSK